MVEVPGNYQAIFPKRCKYVHNVTMVVIPENMAGEMAFSLLYDSILG